MIQNLILHIGQSKTGTSSLQSLMAENRNALIKNGNLYPDIILGGTPLNLVEHNSFAESLSNIKRYPDLEPEQWVEQFKSQMQKHSCHSLILSAESFFGAPQIWTLSPSEDFFETHKKKIERLAALLPAKNKHVVLYLRRQDLWLESAMGHIIRYEGLLGKKIYESEEQLAKLLTPHMNYLHLVDLWEETLKPDKFSIIPYERDALVNGDTGQDFLERTGLDKVIGTKENIPRKLENQSLSAECLILKAALNKTNKTKMRERSIIAILNRMDKRDDLPRTRYTISRDLKQSTFESHRTDNRLLAQKYGGSTGSFFSLPEHDLTSKPPQTPDAAALFAVLCAFEKEYYRPGRFVSEVLYFLKGYLRNKQPKLHGKIKKIIKPLISNRA